MDPKKTPTRRMRRVRFEEQRLAHIEPKPQSRGRVREEVVVEDKNDPRRERD